MKPSSEIETRIIFIHPFLCFVFQHVNMTNIVLGA